MQNMVILSVFFILITMGLLMVIMGQYKEMETINQKNEELKPIITAGYTKLQYDISFKVSLQDIKTKGEQQLKDMQASLVKVTKQLEDKNSEVTACQEEMKIKSDEVATLEESLKTHTAAFKVESEVWKSEIDTLKANLTAPSPICAYVMNKNATESCTPPTNSI